MDYNETPTQGEALFNVKTFNEPSRLDKEIDRLFLLMEDNAPETDEYSATVDQLAKLMKLREDLSSKRHVSPDVMATVIGNLIGIAAMLHYEHGHVIASKALSFILKPRI